MSQGHVAQYMQKADKSIRPGVADTQIGKQERMSFTIGERASVALQTQWTSTDLKNHMWRHLGQEQSQCDGRETEPAVVAQCMKEVPCSGRICTQVKIRWPSGLKLPYKFLRVTKLLP